MYAATITYIVLMQLPTQPVQIEEGIAFFKIFNKSASSLEIEITKGNKFAQIIAIKPGDHHLMPVKSGIYSCGIKGGEKKDCKIVAGQILQIELPWQVTITKTPEPTENKKPITWPEIPFKITFDAKEVDEGFRIHPPIVSEKRPPIVEDVKPKIVEEEPRQKDHPNQAIVEISGVPSDVLIFFDGIKATKTRKWYISPELEPGRSYFYIMKAQVNRNGFIYTDTRQVVVIGGRKTIVNFNLPK